MNGIELLKALRTGTVPKEGLSEIIVGHEAQISELMSELTKVKKDNISSVRFIQGDYGSGKTMLSTYLVEQALSMNFCISQIVIDPTVQLGNFTQVYSAFCRNFKTPNSRDGSGIINILEEWSLQQLRMHQSIEGLSDSATINLEQAKDFMSHIENELVSVRNMDPSLSRAMAAFAGGKVQKNSELSKYALDWIRASDKIPAKDFSKQLGLKGKIAGDNAYNFLKGILLLAKEAGYAGTLIVLDEVETVMRLQQPTQRLKAYEILRHILDDTAAGQFQNSLFLVTATPQFFSETKGIRQYPALIERIRKIKNLDSSGSKKQPILELSPLNESDLSLLATKIRVIHGVAEDWQIMNKISDEGLAALVSHLSTGAFGIKESGPRKFIRELVEAFDLLKEFPEKTIKELLPKIGQADG
ncbi:MAG: BREX system ATP-binding domain-containing protein [Leptospirales bacterium]